MSAQEYVTPCSVAVPSAPARPAPSRAASTGPSHAATGTISDHPPPVNIAGPNSFTLGRQGQSAAAPSAEPAGGDEEPRPIWGVGGVFPKRGKRGGAKNRSFKRAEPSTTSFYSPSVERDDPFSTPSLSPADEGVSAAPNKAPSPSATLHDHEEPPNTSPKEEPSQSPSTSSERTQEHPYEDRQVGGQLMEDGDQWEGRMEAEEDEGPPATNWLASLRFSLREPLAEFLGMLVLVTLGIGADCQVKISQNSAGTYSNMNLVWGMATMVGIYISGGISGAHLNPVITAALAVFRGFPMRLVPRYILAQVLGAFCGALIIYGNYKTALEMFDPDKLVYSETGQNCSAPLFITMPNQTAGGTTQGFFQELLATAILAIVVLALGDENNAPPGSGLGALILALVIVSIGMSMGWISGYAINSARDFGARLALWCLGFGTILWTHDSWWWLVGPICGCFAGALIGCLVYDVCIFVGTGSPVNSSAEELKHAIGLPILHNMVRSARGNADASARAQASREAQVEAGLGFRREARKGQDDSPGAEDAWRRWTTARRKMRKVEAEQRHKRKRRVEEIVREKEKAAKSKVEG